MKVVIITQARMTSTRLPGKVLKKVQGKSLLEHQIERLKRVPSADHIVVATTVNETDQPIVDLCQRLQVSFYRGSEQDVLSRYYEAARQFKADVVVRVTSDCPVIDPQVVGQTIERFLEKYPLYDYVTNVLKRTFPRGMDTEVFSFKALEEAFNEAIHPLEREHVTPFIQNQAQRYKLENITFHEDQSRHRWTVDMPEDLALITRIIDALYPVKKEFDLQDMLALLKKNKEWSRLNAAIEQKKY